MHYLAYKHGHIRRPINVNNNILSTVTVDLVSDNVLGFPNTTVVWRSVWLRVYLGCYALHYCLDEYKLLSDRQHAFRKGHSCETQLTTVINDWAKILDNREQVDTFILDFEKAFDTPPHELLKSKLFSYGIGGRTLNG